jgi:hypothetical protein
MTIIRLHLQDETRVTNRTFVFYECFRKRVKSTNTCNTESNQQIHVIHVFVDLTLTKLIALLGLCTCASLAYLSSHEFVSMCVCVGVSLCVGVCLVAPLGRQIGARFRSFVVQPGGTHEVRRVEKGKEHACCREACQPAAGCL